MFRPSGGAEAPGTAKNMKYTTVRNAFTGYRAVIKSEGVPTVATIKRHIGKSKARDCKSVTKIRYDTTSDGEGGRELSLSFGEILIEGRPA